MIRKQWLTLAGLTLVVVIIGFSNADKDADELLEIGRRYMHAQRDEWKSDEIEILEDTSVDRCCPPPDKDAASNMGDTSESHASNADLNNAEDANVIDTEAVIVDDPEDVNVTDPQDVNLNDTDANVDDTNINDVVSSSISP